MIEIRGAARYVQLPIHPEQILRHRTPHFPISSPATIGADGAESWTCGMVVPDLRGGRIDKLMWQRHSSLASGRVEEGAMHDEGQINEGQINEGSRCPEY